MDHDGYSRHAMVRLQTVKDLSEVLLGLTFFWFLGPHWFAQGNSVWQWELRQKLLGIHASEAAQREPAYRRNSTRHHES